MTESTELTRGAALNKAAAAASARLKAKYIDEWNSYMKTEASTLGQHWSPRLSAEEKERAELRSLLLKHSDILDEFVDAKAPVPEISSVTSA